jgi:hypothetical protein
MSPQEIEERYNKSITMLKSLEQLIKQQETNYETHMTRIGWLKHLADSVVDLRKYEAEVLKLQQAAQQSVQQTVQQTAQQAQALQQVMSPPAPKPEPLPPEVVETKKSKKKES